MDFCFGDFDIINSRRRIEKSKITNPQHSRKCNACKQNFDSGNKLFRHLHSNSDHMCKPHWVHYIVKCKTHPEEYHKHNICVRKNDFKHFVPSKSKFNRFTEKFDETFTECDDMYIEFIKIIPYYREDEAYYITYFDESLIREN